MNDSHDRIFFCLGTLLVMEISVQLRGEGEGKGKEGEVTEQEYRYRSMNVIGADAGMSG